MTEFRAALEPEIAALAAIRIDDRHLASLREAVAIIDRGYNCAQAFIEADLDFHLTLAEPVANPIFLSLIDSIVDLLREQGMLTFQVEGRPERGHLHQVTADSNASTAQPMFLKAGVAQ